MKMQTVCFWFLFAFLSSVTWSQTQDLEIHWNQWNDVHFWLNTNLTTDEILLQLREEYARDGIVTIDNFLYLDKANEMYWFLSQAMTDNNWVSSFMFDFNDHSIDILKGNPQNAEKIHHVKHQCIDS